jgi:hypothetical protein
LTAKKWKKSTENIFKTKDGIVGIMQVFFFCVETLVAMTTNKLKI